MPLVWLTIAPCAAFYLTAVGGLDIRAPFWLAAGTLQTLVSLLACQRGALVWVFNLHLAAFAWGALLGAEVRADQMRHLAVGPGGTARIALTVRHSGCGAHSCFAEGTLERCQPVDPGACPVGHPRVRALVNEELPLYARVTLLAKLAPRTRYRTPTPAFTWPDAQPSWKARLVTGSSPKPAAVSALSRLVLNVRQGLRDGLQQSLTAPHSGIARALLLGESAAVPKAARDAIRGAGVSHILAVSGLHITLLIGSLVGLLRWLWLRGPLASHFPADRVGAGVGAVLAPVVGVLCGGAPSATRAALTGAVTLALRAQGRKPSPANVAALVVLVYLAAAPQVALQPAFMLSVAATTALLAAPRSTRLTRALRDSLRAWLATAPLLLLWFGTTSMMGILANVVLVPIGSLLIPSALAHYVSWRSGAAPWLGSATVFETLSGAFLSLADSAASLDPGLRIAPLTGAQWLVCLIGACTVLSRLPSRIKLMLVAGCLFAGAASEWRVRHPLSPDELRITFLDVGQGDAALLETAEGHAALIDGGGSVTDHGPDPGELAVLPLLRALRIDRVDLVVLSHPHPDHYGGLSAVLDALPVTELWDSGQAEAEDERGPAARLLARARGGGTRIRSPAALCGAPRRLGSLRLSVLAPCPIFDPGYDPNDNSIVVLAEHGSRRFLFLGDAETHQEAALARKWGARRLRADVLKVAHHGSRTSSTDALLSQVNPWLAVISAGRANRFGHPHRAALSRLERHAAEVLRIDEHGGIRLVSDGQTLKVDAWDAGLSLAYGGEVSGRQSAKTPAEHLPPRSR